MTASACHCAPICISWCSRRDWIRSADSRAARRARCRRGSSHTLNDLSAFLPVPEAPVDHYKCYKTAPTKGSPKFATIPHVAVDDQFTSGAKLFDLKKPAHLCMAANKNGEGVPNPTGNLLCYQAVRTKGQPKHAAVSGLFLANQLLQEQADTQTEEELCVPADVALAVFG